MMVRNVNELQEGYEEEFSEFLRQKISHAGGSLQFQHLSGLLQQLRFEIRDAFGVTKPELMKFLRAHSNIFKVNSKGMVTIVNSAAVDSDDCPNKENQNTNTTKSFLPKIKKGKGTVFKIFPDYAIIKARNPIDAYVFFTPLEYGEDKDTLFVDERMDLYIGNRVCFNAIHGHRDYEIEYRATEVWKSGDSDDENICPQRNNKVVETKRFAGEGYIKKLFPNVGFISFSDDGKGYKDIIFYRTSIKGIDIKLRDRVQFVAEYISNEWQATEIIKKKKTNESSDRSQTRSRAANKHNVSEERIKDQPGKIYPYSDSKGAIIKFGKNYSEIADGNLCNFYLYGIRVANADISMEFSEGDDVKFDAIKLKNSPGWKAIVVWVGDKPVGVEIDKRIFEESDKKIENRVDDDDIASDVSSEISNVITRKRRNSNRNQKKEVDDTINGGYKFNNANKPQFDNRAEKTVRGNKPQFSRNKHTFSEGHHKDDGIASMSSEKFSHQDFKHRRNRGNRRRPRRKSSGRNKNNSPDKNRNSQTNRNKEPSKKYNQEKSLENPSVFNITEEIDNNLCTDTMFDDNESTSEESEELPDSPLFQRKFLKEDSECFMDTSTMNESGSESDKDISENNKLPKKGRSSIKKFEAIDGEIISLYCKVAIIKSDLLKKEVDFILNVFYLNGKSVEEQQVCDLKEVIKVGDILKFNCYEIIDDYGNIHLKVTMAWKGLKPEVQYEISAEEFISEQELSVSIRDQQDVEYEESTKSTNIEETCDLNSEESEEFQEDSPVLPRKFLKEDKECFVDTSKKKETYSDSEVSESSQNNRLDNIVYQKPVVSGSIIDQRLSSEVQPEKLSDRILKILETHGGFFSSDPEAAQDVVQEIIDLVLRNSKTGESFNLTQSKDNTIEEDSTLVCSSCRKPYKPSSNEAVNTAEAESQTISTGEIFAASLLPDD